jgi:hypothetical protein
MEHYHSAEIATQPLGQSIPAIGHAPSVDSASYLLNNHFQKAATTGRSQFEKEKLDSLRQCKITVPRAAFAFAGKSRRKISLGEITCNTPAS